MDPNSLEIELLMHNPAALLLNYQQVIGVIVQVYLRSGFFKDESKDEVVQYVNDQLLSRIDIIREQYNGRALLRTYLSAVIRNICAELLRERQRNSFIEYFEEPVESASYETDQLSRIVIKQELIRLETILMLFGPLQGRLEVCLRALYRLPLAKSDFLCCCKNPDDKAVNEAIKYLIQPVPLMEKEVFVCLNQVFNYEKGKTIQPDALRKWVKARTRELIVLLNGDPKRSNYNEETLQILLEKYCIERAGHQHSDNNKIRNDKTSAGYNSPL